jgi:hypothetical protein
MQQVVHAQLLNRRHSAQDARSARGKRHSSGVASPKVSEAYEWFVGVKNIWNASGASSFENNFTDLNATFVRTSFSDDSTTGGDTSSSGAGGSDRSAGGGDASSMCGDTDTDAKPSSFGDGGTLES